MPLEFPDQKHLEAACGYVELGLFSEANEQLERIDAFNRASPEILSLRVEIYRGLKKWELMAEISKRLAEFQPNKVQWRISFAYAVRRFQSVDAAREILLAAERTFPNEAIIKYNLACYACVMGKLESAKEYLKKCFEADPTLRLQGLEDEDLKILWDSLQKTIE